MPTMPSVLPCSPIPSQPVGRKPSQPPRAQDRLGLAHPPGRGQHQRDREVGGGVGQDARACCVTDDAGRPRGVEVDVVHPDPEVGDDPRPPPRGARAARRRPASVTRAEQPVRLAHRRAQRARGGSGASSGLSSRVERRRQPRLDGVGQPAGDDDAGAGRASSDPVDDGDACTAPRRWRIAFSGCVVGIVGEGPRRRRVGKADDHQPRRRPEVRPRSRRARRRARGTRRRAARRSAAPRPCSARRPRRR